MASMEEPIIVRIVNESALGNEAGTTPGTKASSSGQKFDTAGAAKAARGFGTVMASALKLNVAYNLIHEGVEIAKNATNNLLNPIRTILTGITKLIVQLLRPISDMLIVFLLPILQFLKPIIRGASQILKPFREAAFKLMREAMTKTPGSTTQLALLSASYLALYNGLIAIEAYTVKQILNLITQSVMSIETAAGSIISLVIATIISMVTNVSFSEAQKIAKDILDMATTELTTGGDALLKTYTDQMAKSTTTMSNNLISSFKSMDVRDGFDDASARAQEAMRDWWRQLGDAAANRGRNNVVTSTGYSGSWNTSSSTNWIAPDGQPGSSAFTNTGPSYGDNWLTTLQKANASKLPTSSILGG